MALVIRFRQVGKNNRQTYRLVVANTRSPRDGKYVEKLGWYNPFAEPDKCFFVETQKVEYWIDRGALVSERVKSMLKKAAPEIVKSLNAKKENKLKKVRAKINKNKAKTTAKPAKSSAPKKK
ncbi:MAG: 30S ribosomal protein S16 [Chlamydiae bacterium]|nr:30S ribosomal protein S16 [Chlamydiota bacterium]